MGPVGDGSNVGIGYWNEGNDPFINRNNLFANNIAYQCKRNFYADGDLINTDIINNTFVNSRYFTNVQISDGNHINSSFKNNIIVQDDDLSCIYYTSNVGVTFRNNLYSKPPIFGTGDIIGDPLFADSFKLKSNSPAINAGINTGITSDYFNNIRTGIYDIGAAEAGATYYVGPSGKDSNNGSSSSPFLTLNYAVTKTVSGDVIHVNPGILNVSNSVSLPIGVSIEGENSIIKATSGITVLNLISSTPNTNGNQHMTGLVFDGNNLTGDIACNVEGRSNVEIFNCTFHNFKTIGVIFGGAGAPGTLLHLLIHI
jgi:hypothetical protein